MVVSETQAAVAAECLLDGARATAPAELRPWRDAMAGRRVRIYRLGRGRRERPAGPWRRETWCGVTGLVAKGTYEPGEWIVLPVHQPGHDGSLYLGEVRFVRRSPQGACSLGVQLLSSVEDPSGDRPIPREWLVGEGAR